MTTTLSFDPRTPTTDDDRYAVERQVGAILEAARAGDAERLAGFHLYGPKFTKFDDMEPLERQDADEARAGEDGLVDVDNFTYRVNDLRVDVFGPAAIATFVLDYAFDAEGEHLDLRARTTLVLVADGPEWRIAHEHLSPFKSNP